MSSYITVFPGTTLPPSVLPYTSITISANVTLAWTTDFGVSPAYVASWMDISATANGYSLILPNAMNQSVGFAFWLNNTSSHTFNLVANDGQTVISAISSNSLSYFLLYNNGTPNGSWRQTPFTGTTSVTSVGVNTSGTGGNIVTSGSPITSSGTITLSLGADLAGLTGLSNSTGLAVRTANTGTWSTTSILGTANQITLTNGNGIAGQPTISLASAISGINSISLTAGNINIGVTPNTIAATNANGSLFLTTNGTGIIQFDPNGTEVAFVAPVGLGVTSSLSLILADSATPNSISLNAHNVGTSYQITLPGSLPVASQIPSVSTVVGGVATLTWVNAPTFSGTSVANTIPIYTNTSGSLGDTSVTITGGNAISNVASIAVGDVIITSASNLISTTVGNLNISSVGGSIIGFENSPYLFSSLPLFFSSSAVGTDHYVAFKAPSSISTNTIWTLPGADGTSNQVLSTNGSGTLSWQTVAGGTVTSITQGTNMSFSVSPITTTGTINLSTTLTGLTSVAVGTQTLTGSNINSSGSLVLATNGSTAAITLNTSQHATFANSISTAPAASAVSTLSFGSAYQNTLGYDVTLTVYIAIAANTSGVIQCGVGPTNTPSQQTLLTGSTVIGFFPVSVYLPASYYALISQSGTMTASIVGQQVTPV